MTTNNPSAANLHESDPQEPYVAITLSLADAQALYDHTGTMPYAPGSWSNNVRDELSEALHYAT